MKVGDRVILTSPDYIMSNSHKNPRWLRNYSCVGTITRVFSPDDPARRKYFIDVLWDNGEDNNYNENNLSLYKEEL